MTDSLVKSLLDDVEAMVAWKDGRDVAVPLGELRALAAECERLRAALGFYADARQYKSQPTPDAERGYYPTHVPVETDGGKRARAVLGVADDE